MGIAKEIAVGREFGKLTVTGPGPLADSCGKHRSTSRCICDCGKEKVVFNNSLLMFNTTSCGCSNIVHGHSKRGKKTTEYIGWSSMIRRCTNKSYSQFRDYGGRGISVCERWLNSFENFLADMGPKPTPNHSIDRFPNKNGNYEPGNCRWATRVEQQNNMRSNRIIEIDGVKKTASEWSHKSGVKHFTICQRLDAGWPTRDAVWKPATPRSLRRTVSNAIRELHQKSE